jgi:hypothetical protein
VIKIENLAVALHEISEKALFLYKLMILERFSETNDFTHEWAISFANTIDLSKDKFHRLLSMVNTDPALSCGRPPSSENKTKRDEIVDAMNRHVVIGNPVCMPNISFALGYEAERWSTVYKNNVFMHFDKYVKACIQVMVDENIVLLHPELQGIPKWEWRSEHKLESRSLRNKWVKQLLYVLDESSRDLSGIPNILSSMLPEGFLDPKKRLYEQKTNPELFFVYMIYMNRWLEEHQVALFSPFPIRTSFVPAHFTMDTQMLLDNFPVGETTFEEIKLIFQENLERLAPDIVVNLETVKSKHMLLGSPKKFIMGDPPSNITGIWKTALWVTLTNIPEKYLHIQHGSERLRFNNMVSVNGYKVSMHYCIDRLYGTNRFAKGTKKPKVAKKTKAEKHENSPTHLTAANKSLLLESNLVYIDPGKNNLVTITTGYLSGPKIQYTARQRRHEMGSTQAAHSLHRKLDAYKKVYGVDLKEIQSTFGNAKTCFMDVFTAYVRTRNMNRNELCLFYKQMFFRRARMRALVQGRSSLDKLVHKIKMTFEEPERPVTMVYGNWSQTAMRYQPPTQGLGLRRHLSKYFQVVVIDEHKTSQRCPRNSQHRVEHPIGCKSKKSKKGTQRDKNHGVLRCPNEKCKSMTWDRDVLSTVNMRIKMRYEWRTNKIHPWFSREKTQGNVAVSTGSESA